MHLPGIKVAVLALNAITAPVCSPLTCDTTVSPIAPLSAILGTADGIFHGLTAPVTGALGLEDEPAVTPRRRRHR